jgi:cyclopropane-fatty-acyl-phospholipid synthase
MVHIFSTAEVKAERGAARHEGWQGPQDAARDEDQSKRRLDSPHPPRGARTGRLDRWVAERLLRGLGSPPVRIVLASGEEVTTSDAEPVARVVLRDRATLWKLAARPRLEFGEAYSDGRLEVEGSLADLLTAAYRAAAAARRPGKVPSSWRAQWTYAVQSNTLAGSRRHIHHHYDIGNDFYQLWLDKELLYTCAYFPDPSVSLEQAQEAKMEYVCRKVWLRPGETVLEAGCGWGALALYMARKYGVSVRAFNISREQVAHARRRAQAEGLTSRVEFIEDDYRNMTGKCDVFVSVGMMEHVGPNHYHEFGRTIHRVLSARGRGLIHTIGQSSTGGVVNPWIRRRIFPGAYPPSLKQLAAMLEPWQFAVLDVENLRLHYAETLRHWLARFDAAEDRVRKMFDDRFVRMWRLYLTGSMAAFRAGALELFQVVFARSETDPIPWTRAGIYRDFDGSM